MSELMLQYSPSKAELNSSQVVLDSAETVDIGDIGLAFAIR